jgi:hypothetical protein
MSENPYKKFSGISNSQKNFLLVEEIIKMRSNGANIDEVSKKFNEEIEWYNFRDVEAKQFAVYYIARQTNCSEFRKKNDFTIVY